MANDQDPVQLNDFYEVLRTSLGKLSVLDGVNKRICFFSELSRLLERLEWV
jgi:hypothetical protein